METWELVGGQLVKEFTFQDFTAALGFVNKVGELAENANHHPTVTLTYGRVQISLVTHSERRVTAKDYDLAKQIDAIKTD